MTPKDTSTGEEELFEPKPRERVERSRRLVNDEEGQVWRIREVRFADTAPSLVFEAEGVFRRVRRYPANWYELTDDQLYELSWKT
jgi:hypothetical protein